MEEIFENCENYRGYDYRFASTQFSKGASGIKAKWCSDWSWSFDTQKECHEKVPNNTREDVFESCNNYRGSYKFECAKISANSSKLKVQQCRKKSYDIASLKKCHK